MQPSLLVLATLAGVAFGGVLPRDVDPSQVPDFGVPRNNQPSATTGDCVGANNVRIPCRCPPARDDYLAALNKNVNTAGLKFPADSSKASACIRANTMVKTLQDLMCPAVSAPNIASLQKQSC